MNNVLKVPFIYCSTSFEFTHFHLPSILIFKGIILFAISENVLGIKIQTKLAYLLHLNLLVFIPLLKQILMHI